MPGSTDVASNDDLENRVRRLEMTVQSLLQTQPRNQQTADALRWWERIAGTFHGDEEYRQAMSIAASIRRDQEPEDENNSRSPSWIIPFAVAVANANLPGPKRKDPWMRDISFEKLAKKPLCDYENNWELHA